MCTMMKDPVLLPTSNTVVDRSTIIQHLLSIPLDPFNRAPLTIEQVVADVELKQKIGEWKKARLAEKMDTTE
jgi:hypothetical protein